jgi:hypothetical protein
MGVCPKESLLGDSRTSLGQTCQAPILLGLECCGAMPTTGSYYTLFSSTISLNMSLNPPTFPS